MTGGMWSASGTRRWKPAVLSDGVLDRQTDTTALSIASTTNMLIKLRSNRRIKSTPITQKRDQVKNLPERENQVAGNNTGL
jgi:hypothetical protein